MARIFRNKAEKEFHLQKWEQSNLTKAQYCKDNNISIQTFYKWLRKKKDNKENTSANDFVKLEPILSSVSQQAQIILPNGIEIRICVGEVVRIIQNLKQVL